MNWRRGVVLAGVNLAVAMPMICILASEDARARRDLKERSASEDGLWIDSSGEISVAPAKIVRTQEEQTVSFSLCGMWVQYPAQTYVVQLGECAGVRLEPMA